MISFLEYHKNESAVDKTEAGSKQDLKIFLVDDFKIRDLSLQDEEFSNYAIHEDFPKLIPKGEVWISKRSKDTERGYYVDEALKRIQYSRSGMNSKKAYEKAIEWSKAHRGKLEGRYIAKVEEKGTIHKELLTTVNDIKVYSVDARAVRDLYKIDYVEGGHGYVYDFIPKDEIWIEDGIAKDEIKYIIEHEYVESQLMKDKGMSYQKAHERASRAEYESRTKGAV